MIPDNYAKLHALFDNQSPACNFFMKLEYATAPWPANCRIYQHTLSCNKYEISRDNKHVHSCQLVDPKKSNTCKKVEPKCLEYYPPVENGKHLFQESGRQCHFRESVFPFKPWPQGCQVF